MTKDSSYSTVLVQLPSYPNKYSQCLPDQARDVCVFCMLGGIERGGGGGGGCSFVFSVNALEPLGRHVTREPCMLESHISGHGVSCHVVAHDRVKLGKSLDHRSSQTVAAVSFTLAFAYTCTCRSTLL